MAKSDGSIGAYLSKAFFGALACMAISLVYAADHSPASSASASSASEIRMAVAQAVINLDPRFASDAASARVNRLLYQSLVDFDGHYQVQAQLATWRQLDDKQWQFTLKAQPVYFHNGLALTAHDIAATYLSFKTLASPLSGEFANIADIQVDNPQQLRFILRQADADFVSKLIIGILPAQLIQQQHDFNQVPIGSGPLQLVNRQDGLLFKRRSDGQMIRLLEIKDPTVRALKLRHGEVDILQGDLPPELLQHLQGQRDMQISVSRGSNFSYLGLNCQHPYLREPLVRQALAYAIDSKAIVQYALVPGSRPATAILPPEHWAGNGALQPYPYQPEKARQLLQQAGVPLPLQLHYKTSSDTQRLRLATILQAQMAKAGIQLVIDSHDWGTFFGDIQRGRFELYSLTWVGIKTPDIYSKAFASANTPPQGFNRGRYQDAQLDRWLAQRNWPLATQRIHQQLPYLPLWYEGQVVAYRKPIQGFSANPDGNWDDLARVQKSP